MPKASTSLSEENQEDPMNPLEVTKNNQAGDRVNEEKGHQHE